MVTWSNLYRIGVGGRQEAIKEEIKQLSRLKQKVLYLVYQNQPCPIKTVAKKGFILHATVCNAIIELIEKNYIDKVKKGRCSYLSIKDSRIAQCFAINDREYERRPNSPRIDKGIVEID